MNAPDLLSASLTGERAEIEPLAEVRLEKPLSGFWEHPDIATISGNA